MKTFSMWAFVFGFLLGIAVQAWLNLQGPRAPAQVRYIYVQDLAANRGVPTCPKINSGQILKASEREGTTGQVVLTCKYNRRSDVNDLPLPKM